MMNPIALFTYYLTRTVSMGDVGRNFFIKRKMSHRIVYGPGVIAVTDGVTISNCHFAGCDFLVVPEGTYSQASLEMRDCTCHRVRFQGVTFLGTQEFVDKIRAGTKFEADDMVIIYGSPMPSPVGIG